MIQLILFVFRGADKIEQKEKAEINTSVVLRAEETEEQGRQFFFIPPGGLKYFKLDLAPNWQCK